MKLPALQVCSSFLTPYLGSISLQKYHLVADKVTTLEDGAELTTVEGEPLQVGGTQFLPGHGIVAGP